MNKVVKLLLVVCCLVLPLPAAAQAPSLEDKVRYILEVSDLGNTMDAIMSGFRPMIVDQMKSVSNKITPELAEHIVNIMAEELKNIEPEFKSFVVGFYQEQLSEEEIGALYDFYRTPVGASVARKTTKVASNLVPQTQTFMERHFLPRFQARFASDEKLRKALSP